MRRETPVKRFDSDVSAVARSLPRDLLGTFAKSMSCATDKTDVDEAKRIADEVRRTREAVTC